MVPDRLNAPRTRLAVPLFVSTTDWEGLVAPTVSEPNVKLLEESAAAGAVGAVPVPDNETLCGLPAALLPTLALAVRVPVAVGWNDTLNAQVALGINVALLQVLVTTR